MLRNRPVGPSAGGNGGGWPAPPSSQRGERGPTPPLRYFRTLRVLSDAPTLRVLSDGRALRVLSDGVGAPTAVFTSVGRAHAPRGDTQKPTAPAHARSSTVLVRPRVARVS